MSSKGSSSGSSVKWLRRLLTRKPRTPMPPKPYTDVSAGIRTLTDPRLQDYSKLDTLQPDKPHWHANAFAARSSTPIFDIFGYNQDWSWTLYKLTFLSIFLFVYYEVRMVVYDNSSTMRIAGSGVITARPSYKTAATDDDGAEAMTQEAALRKAGITLVGVEQLDSIGLTPDKIKTTSSSSSSKDSATT